MTKTKKQLITNIISNSNVEKDKLIKFSKELISLSEGVLSVIDNKYGYVCN